jgi:hypothetical protein
MSGNQLHEQSDDRIPAEKDIGHEQLIALLRRSLRGPVDILASEQSQIIARVRDRLVWGGEPSYNLGDRSAKQPGDAGSAPIVFPRAKRKPLPHWVRDCVAVLLVGLLVGASLFLFWSLHQQGIALSPSGAGSGATGPSAQVEVDGLRATLHVVTQEPYFLSELLSVDVALTNTTSTPFSLDGTSKPDSACFTSALSVAVSGGSPPSYIVPRPDIGCLDYLPLTTVAPRQTLTIHQHLPVTMSGVVTVAMGGMGGTRQAPTLDGHWPSLAIHVASQVPSDRALSLHNQGTQVIIQAPPAAREHLLYMESITCDGYVNGGLADWRPLPTTLLSQPACPTAHKHWKYVVSAPGYTVVAGSRDA